MSNVGVTFSTNIDGKLGINGNLNLSPYAIDYRGRQYNKFHIAEHGILHPLRLTNMGFTTSYSLSGEGKINGNDGSKTNSGGPGSNDGNQAAADYYRRIYYHPVTGEYIPGGWLYYTNPNVPWSLNFNYSFNLSRTYQYTNNKLIEKNTYTQTLGITGNIKLTPQLSMNGNTGLDIMAGKITTSQISATYDLHCFNISVQWVPFGKWQTWSFRIAANASALADLLRYRKSSSFWDR